MTFRKHTHRYLFATPETIGRQGENKVASSLCRVSILGMDGKILQNVYVPNGDGTFSEIDLLYITRKGIFVIESKNYSGYIFGDDKSVNWTSTLYSDKSLFGKSNFQSRKFYNPIWQNEKHVKVLRRYLGADIAMFSLVVFSENCEFKNVDISSSHSHLCQLESLPTVIRRIWNFFPDTLTDTRVMGLYHALASLREKTAEERAQHASHLNAKFSSTEVCPLCKGKLVRRTAKTGKNAGRDFLGCSNYPSCKYTKNL